MTTMNREQTINTIRAALKTGKTEGLGETLASIRERREDAFTPRYAMTDVAHLVEVPYAHLLWCAIPANDRQKVRDAVQRGEEAFVAYASTDHGQRMILVLGWVEHEDAIDEGKGFTFHDLLPLIDRIETTTFDVLSDCAAVTEARGTRKGMLHSAAQVAMIATIIQMGRQRGADVLSRVNNFMGMLSPLVTDGQLKSLSPLVMAPLMATIIRAAKA